MKIVVVGAGNWGTTLANIFSQRCDVSLWTNTSEQAEEINTARENRKYLPGISLSERLSAVRKFDASIDANDIVVMAVPSNRVRGVASELSGMLNNVPLVCASKGFEHTTMKTMSDIIREETPGCRVVVLSGPNIAGEIASGKPTKAVLASDDLGTVTMTAKALKNNILSFEICNDMKGVELCAALKGVIAVGVGIADGLDLGKNFTGLLMTYGLREFIAIAEFMGISPKTIYGIAGLGDLIATCLSHDSRNRKFGYMVGKGVGIKEALQNVGMVVEGVQMAKTIAELHELNVPIPLFSTISKVIFKPNGHLPDRFIKCLIQYR